MSHLKITSTPIFASSLSVSRDVTL